MRISPSGNRRRQLLAALMLAAFAVRALVPAGFMPAGGGAFSIEICPEGFSAQLLPHGHHHPGGSPTHTEHCVFGSAGASGPVRQLAAPGDVALLQHTPAARCIAAATAVRLVHLPQARGPPVAT